jgi:hypothetical protein
MNIIENSNFQDNEIKELNWKKILFHYYNNNNNLNLNSNNNNNNINNNEKIYYNDIILPLNKKLQQYQFFETLTIILSSLI